MKLNTAFKSLSAVAALALAGCLGANPEEGRATRAETLKFVQTSSAPLAKTTEGMPGEAELVAQLEQLGCPKLAKLFKDLSDPSQTQNGLPQSFVEYLSCFGLSPTPTQDEIAQIQTKSANPQELLNCICGGTALSEMFQGVKWTEFKATASGAAGTSFQSSATGGAGDKFESTTDLGGFESTTKLAP